MADPPHAKAPRSLVWATDIDVLPDDRIVVREKDHLVVRCPSNPHHWWGTFVLFDDAPSVGDGDRWERVFAQAFADVSRVGHRAFCWDRTDGELCAAQSELVERGYELEHSVGLVAEVAEVRAHPRANREVVVRALDPDGDERLWEAVVELQVAGGDSRIGEGASRAFSRARLRDLRVLFGAGRGGWFVALSPEDQLVGSCGVVVTDGRGRFQTVDTAAAHRRRGICSRLVVEVAAQAAQKFGARQLVIVADAEYHALGLYESLGFRRRERVCGALRRPL